MANLLNFKFGQHGNLPSTKEAGTVYITTDEQAMYIDLATNPSDESIIDRIRIGDIIVKDDLDKLGPPPYAEGAFYYIAADNALLRYNNGKWVQINTVSDVQASVGALETAVEKLKASLAAEVKRSSEADTSHSTDIENLTTAVNARVTTETFEAFKTTNSNAILAAQTTADNAKTAADTAQDAAEVADAKAVAADDKAVAAQETIDDYIAAHANDYTNTQIDSAVADAKKAGTDAAAAASTADGKAVAAQTAAENAQTKANSAYTLAEGKTTMAAVQAVLDENYATKSHVSTSINAVTGGSNQTIATTYALAETANAKALANETALESKASKSELTAALEPYAKTEYVDSKAAELLGSDANAAGASTIFGANKAAANAQTAADTADGKAVAAQTAADNAQLAAEGAQADATKALTDADNAKKAADAAQADIDAWEIAHSGDYTNSKIDELVADAKLAGTNAGTAAGNAQSAAENAQAAAEAAQSTADQAVTDASNAKDAADAAQTDASEALRLVAVAQTTADQGVSDAAAAKTAADNAQAAAEAAQGTASAALPLKGGTMTGVIDMGTHKITNLVDPTNDQDAATMAYVKSQMEYAKSTMDAMTFKGVVDCGQEDGTTTKPADAAANKGDVYKVARRGTYAGIAAKAGDLLIYEGDDGTTDASKWTLVTSGYEDEYLQEFSAVGVDATDSNNRGIVLHLSDGLGDPNGAANSASKVTLVGAIDSNLHFDVSTVNGAPVVTASMTWGSF